MDKFFAGCHVFRNFKTFPASQVTEVLGRVGFRLNTPFINLDMSGWLPNGTLWCNEKEETALLAVLMLL